MSTYEENVAGSSKGDATTRKRKRARSPSSDSDTSSSSSSSSSSRSRHRRRKGRKSRRNKGVSTNLLKQLISDVNDLKCRMAPTPSNSHEDVFIDPNVSGELYECDELSVDRAPVPSLSAAKLDSSINTKIKEPTVPSTPDSLLEKLMELQRFQNSDWSSVRYADVQKLCLHSPGFTNLEPNDEVKQYDNSKFATHMEKAFASLTYALLKQHEALQNEFNTLLLWFNSNEALSYPDIYTKLNDVLSKGEYSSAANNTIQLVCGHRAELIQQRREGILSSVKDPVHKTALRKIPPSPSNLFEAEKFSSLLDKSGGVRKVFWQKNMDRNPAPQNDPGTSSHVHAPKKGPSKPQQKKQGPRQSGQTVSFRGRDKPPRGRNDRNKRARAYSPSSRRDRRDEPKRN